jgi:hypothetical protein
LGAGHVPSRSRRTSGRHWSGTVRMANMYNGGYGGPSLNYAALYALI